MDADLDLQKLRAFRAAARAGSITAAALALGAPKSTVSKRIADLEGDLGVRLIERTTRAFRVTAEGEVLAARADRLLSDAEDIRRSLTEAGAAARGHLRIAVPTLMGHLLMGRIAAAFRARHPEITLEVHVLDRAPDLLEEGFDGAVRVGAVEEGSLVARTLLRTSAVVVASPDLPGLEGVARPEDLLGLPLVGHTTPWAGAWTLEDGAGREACIPAEPPLRLASLLAIRDAVAAGAGAAVLPVLLVGGDLGAGRLLRLLPGWSGASKPLRFVYPSAQSMTARLRAFIDLLAEEMREPAAGGTGQKQAPEWTPSTEATRPSASVHRTTQS
jgi:DNA-binding transcriptional LysR family regulator